MLKTHCKTVRNFQISLVQRNREKPSNAAAAVPKAELPAQLKSGNLYFCKFSSLCKPLETQNWHSLTVSITR